MLLPLFRSDPQLMERAQTRQDAPSQPDRIFSFDRVTRSVNFELAPRDLEREFVVQSIGQTGDSGPSTDEHDILQKDGAVIRIYRKDAIVHQVGQTTEFVQRMSRRCRRGRVELFWRSNGLSSRGGAH